MFCMLSIGMANVFGTNANQLVALAALLRERSVTAAARKVGITQSAMSGTLAQLRETFADPLLVRVGRSMQPTPRALALMDPLQRAMAALDEALTQPTAFDPKTSEARFTLALDDRAEMMIVPELMRRIRDEAPGISVQVHAWGRHRAPPGLASGELDVAVGVFVTNPSSAAALRRLRRSWPSSSPELVPPGHHTAPMLELGLASIVRTDHPRVGKRLDLDTFCALDHVLVTEEPWAMGVIDDALARLRRHRRIAVRVPRLLGVGRLVARTDLCASMDERMAWLHAQGNAVRILDPPITVPGAELSMLWHDRTHRDPARLWLREQLSVATAGCGEAHPVKKRRARS
jgi:DNA-binding transcriptional LysR family regulator